MKIAIACGGTGGHTFPGISTGKALSGRGHEVELLVAGREIESQTLSGWQGKVFATRAPKSPRRVDLYLASLLRLVRHFAHERPDAVLSMGSYNGVPPVLAAWLLRIPVLVHEANAVPGRSNQFASVFAKAAAFSFPGSCKGLLCKKKVLTGLPVREELVLQSREKKEKPRDCFTVFVTGGSQGAVSLNRLASKALAILAKKGNVKSLEIVHQCGAWRGAYEEVAKEYRDAGANATVEKFFGNMGDLFASSDIVVSRAGAATCAEIALFALPSVLVPLPSAKRDHQRLNARHLEKCGAAILADQDKTTPEELADCIFSLYSDREKLSRMGEASLSMANPDAAGNLADLVEETARR